MTMLNKIYFYHKLSKILRVNFVTLLFVSFETVGTYVVYKDPYSLYKLYVNPEPL